MDNEQAWDTLFDQLDLDAQLSDQGYAPVSAEQIKGRTGREPRLMSKFDTREQRPAALRTRGCTVVPVTNQQYWVVKGDGYQNLDKKPLPQWHRAEKGRQLVLQSLPRQPHSESEALEIASSCSILEAFLGEDVLLTRRGRRRTKQFGYWFSGQKRLRVQVDGVQVEIDGCYERERVYVVEAKLGTRSNFLTRQLYYPLRMLRSEAPEDRVSKAIVPVFMTYSGGLFTFHEYAYSDESEYHSLRQVRSACYTLDPTPYPRLSELLERTPAEPEPLDVPFPQANSVETVSDVVDAIAQGIVSRAEIAQRYEFDERHANYYVAAARYLGLLDREHALTDQGRALVNSPSAARVALLASRMLATPVFRAAASSALGGHTPETAEIAEQLHQVRAGLSAETRTRRAQTISSWLRWALTTFPESR